MLQVLFFSIALGMGVANLPDKERTLLVDLFDGLTNVVIRIIQGLMKMAPLGGVLSSIINRGQTGMGRHHNPRAICIHRPIWIVSISLWSLSTTRQNIYKTLYPSSSSNPLHPRSCSLFVIFFFCYHAGHT